MIDIAWIPSNILLPKGQIASEVPGILGHKRELRGRNYVERNESHSQFLLSLFRMGSTSEM
jgi:hypothetical protein